MTLRPLIVTATVGVVACGLLVAAVGLGWLGPDADRGAEFCERALGVVRQPANSWSNLGFVAAGLLIAWHERLGSAMGPLGTPYAVVVLLLGPGSAAMHATESAAGGVLDLLSMLLLACFAFAYAVVRLSRSGPFVFWGLYAASLALAVCSLLVDWRVPFFMHPTNVVFGALLVVAAVGEALLWRRASGGRDAARVGLAALTTMVAALLIWRMSQQGWCDPGSWLQGHAVWHLLCALAAYLLYRLYAVATPLRVARYGS